MGGSSIHYPMRGMKQGFFLWHVHKLIVREEEERTFNNTRVPYCCLFNRLFLDAKILPVRQTFETVGQT